MRWLFIAAVLTGCVARENDCNYCIKLCKPYSVAVCEQGPFGVTCSCDPRFMHPECPTMIWPAPEKRK